jgi:hypothetical protein
MPSRKWIAAQVSAIGAFVVALINSGWELSADLQIVLVGLAVQALVTYLIPNSDTAGAARPADPAPQRA